MAIFVIFRTADPAKVGQAILDNFQNEFMDLGDGTWLVSSKGTAKDVSDKIGLSSPSGNSATGNGIVFRMDSYFGRAPTNIWDWIKVKIEGSDG